MNRIWQFATTAAISPKRRQLVGIRPVHVLDDQQQRTALRRRLDQLRKRQSAAALPRGDLHRLLQRGELRIDRCIDEIAQEDDLVDGVAPGQRPPHCRGPLVRRRIGAEAEQAQGERGDRTPAGRLAEVEHLRGMHCHAALARRGAHGVHQRGLADARFATHDDRSAVAAVGASVERR